MLPLSPADHAMPADHAACRQAIRQGSRTFHAASLLLPLAIRTPAYGLYAFCRLSDDAVDGEASGPDAVERLRRRLVDAYDGSPAAIPADRAMADLVRDYAIPLALPEALLEGLAWDLEGRTYATPDALNAYAARVAGTVGVMMCLLMRVREPAVLARACDLGVAMQLTNIARDVGEDARAGRLYLPLQWLAEEGIEPHAFLAAPRLTPGLRRVVRRLLAAADQLYQRSEAGIPHLPAACRSAMFAARFIYAEIGRELERRDLDSVSGRARVSASRKVGLLARSVAAAALGGRACDAPCIPEAAFLVHAVTAVKPPAPIGQEPDWTLARLDHRIGRVLDMFERLARREQYGVSGTR